MDKSQMRAERLEYFRAQAEEYNHTREFSKAMTFYVRAGLLGDWDSIREVCRKLQSGYGMPGSYDELFRCMEVGAKAGIAEAMYELGVCFSSGIGTEIDRQQAMHWYSEGAKAGNTSARRSLLSYNYDIHIEKMEEPAPYAYEVRQKVFVEEQGFVDEPDEIDRGAVHFVVFDGNRPVGVCRLFRDVERDEYVTGRFGVLKEYRGIGIGTELMEQVVEYVGEHHGDSIALHSQMQAKDFYERLGFEAEGEPEEEQGALHVWMSRNI